MEKHNVEHVFKTEGIPDLTFVEPGNYGEVLIDFRSSKKPVIIEGPSGSGKTVTATKLVQRFYADRSIVKFSGRVSEDADKLRNSLESSNPGQVLLIDDFHRFPSDLQKQVGDKVKLIAESESSEVPKCIIIGINQLGQGLIQLTPDLLKRVGVHKIPPADMNKTSELIEKGSEKLNIQIPTHEIIYAESKGDYWLIQKLCQNLCILNKIFETSIITTKLDVDLTSVRRSIISALSNGYEPAVIEFCRGRRFRPGNTTYFKLLRSIAQTGENSINIDKLAADNPEIKPSVDQLKTKRLTILIQDRHEVRRYFYYHAPLKQFSIEDPAMGYYLRHLDWLKIERDCGFKQNLNVYDIAVSFAGSSRTLVEKVVDRLKEEDVNVFYDHDYEAKFLGTDMGSKFHQIYSSEAKLVLVFLDEEYEKKVWPRFERMCFQSRIGKDEVVPIFLTSNPTAGIPKALWGIQWDSYPSYSDIPKEKIDDAVKKIVEKLSELETTAK